MKTKSRTRREPTQEQKDAAATRRAGIKQICAMVTAMPEEKRIELAASYGIRTAEGRELSPYNQCLLISQNSAVSIVGGFSQWRALDRCVKKGSRALAIWVPCKGKIEAGEGAMVPAGTDPAALENKFFVIGNVFDISQTETTAEREARESQTLALPAPALALPEHAEAIDIDAEDITTQAQPEPIHADTHAAQLCLL